MVISKSKLRKITHEELDKLLQESPFGWFTRLANKFRPKPKPVPSVAKALEAPLSPAPLRTSAIASNFKGPDITSDQLRNLFQSEPLRTKLSPEVAAPWQGELAKRISTTEPPSQPLPPRMPLGSTEPATPWAWDPNATPARAEDSSLYDAMAHVAAEDFLMSLPEPTMTPANLRKKYFGPDPDVEYRRVDSPSAIQLPVPGNRIPEEGAEMFEYTPSAEYGTAIGTGAFRKAYNIPGIPDKVLKVSREVPPDHPSMARRGESVVNFSIRTRKMNKFEASPEYQSNPLALKVYEAAPDYSWIVQERATPINDWEGVFEHFPNFKKTIEMFHSSRSPGRPPYGHYRPRRELVATASEIFGKKEIFPNILQFNKPIDKKALDIKERTLAQLRNRWLVPGRADRPGLAPFLNQLEELRISVFEGPPPSPKQIRDYRLMKKDVEIARRILNDPAIGVVNKLLKYRDFWLQYTGAIPSKGNIVDMVNSLILDPQISNIRDFASKTSPGKGPMSLKDFRPGNLGYVIKPDGTKQLKIIDSGAYLDHIFSI